MIIERDRKARANKFISFPSFFLGTKQQQQQQQKYPTTLTFEKLKPQVFYLLLLKFL